MRHAATAAALGLLAAVAAGPAAAVFVPTDCAAAGAPKEGCFTAGNSLGFYQNLTDGQLESIFTTYGTPVMPSQEPNYEIPAGEAWYDFCVGRTLINVATTNASAIVGGVWPFGPAHPLNNLFMRGWWGKVFYNDGSNPKVTQIWNLLYGNGTVDFDAIAYQNASARLTADGKDSIFVDYALTDFIGFRTVIDEVRLVNQAKNIYLGHIWASNPVDTLQRKGYKNKVDEVLYKGTLAALNSTWLDFIGFGGLDTVGAARYVPADYFTLGWFVMQCIGPKAPKIKYAWTAYLFSLIDTLTGFYRPEAALPRLPSAPSKDPSPAGPGFPSPSYGAGTVFPRLHIWPFKISDFGQIGPNVTKIPHFKGEPVLGEAKLYPITTQGVNTWSADGSPDPSWTPTDVELKAADIAKFANGPLQKLIANEYSIKPDLTPSPPLPADHVNPTWNAALAAIHAIEAANQAAKAAAANPTAPVNGLAKLIKTKEYTGKLLVNFPDGVVGLLLRGALADKAPKYNLTGFADYIDTLKHQAFADLPKLNYTPPQIVWEGDLKNITLDKISMKLGGVKDLDQWKADLKAALMGDDATTISQEHKAAMGHGLAANGGGRF